MTWEVVPGQNRRCDFCPRDKTGDKTILPHCCPDKTVLPRRYVLVHVGTGLRLSQCLSGQFGIFFDWAGLTKQTGSSRHLQTDDLNRLDFSKRRNENPFRFHSGVVLHDMNEGFYFYTIIFSQKEMEKRETHSRRGCSRHDWTDLFLLDHFLTKRNGKRETLARRGCSSSLAQFF